MPWMFAITLAGIGCEVVPILLKEKSFLTLAVLSADYEGLEDRNAYLPQLIATTLHKKDVAQDARRRARLSYPNVSESSIRIDVSVYGPDPSYARADFVSVVVFSPSEEYSKAYLRSLITAFMEYRGSLIDSAPPSSPPSIARVRVVNIDGHTVEDVHSITLPAIVGALYGGIASMIATLLAGGIWVSRDPLLRKPPTLPSRLR